jgi:YfiH family protein
MSADNCIRPDWSELTHIRALTTIRSGGVSIGAYESLNLGDHVGDDPEAVARNRKLLRESLRLPAEPLWLKQVHGTTVVNAAEAHPGVTADGAWTDKREVVLAVLTADCLPVFLCDKAGTRIALLHAGWRGLAAGIVEDGVRALNVRGAELVAWLGPAIGPEAYEVGDDVRSAFVAHDPGATSAFRQNGSGRWLADMYGLARRRLVALGVTDISGGDHCTFRERDKFFSYRRDGATGRMASLLWLA